MLQAMFKVEMVSRRIFKNGTLFSEVVVDPDKRDRLRARPSAEKRFAIFFTPRSGSSRITDLAASTGVLSNPGEYFNPRFVPNSASALQATSLEDLVDVLSRVRNTQGVFGCEVTYAQILQTCGSARNFFKLMKPEALVWLIREDIVAQAVSISRMVQTGQGHVVSKDAGNVTAEANFQYKPKMIMGSLTRIRWMELRTEWMFALRRLSPLRLSYESVIRMSEHEVMELLANHVGAGPVPASVESKHRKIGSGKSKEFAAQFRAENSDLIASLDRARAPMLAKLRAG